MGTDVKVRPHHQKFFEELKARASAMDAEAEKPRLELKEKARLALEAANGNKQKAARLLGWTNAKIRYQLETP